MRNAIAICWHILDEVAFIQVGMLEIVAFEAVFNFFFLHICTRTSRYPLPVWLADAFKAIFDF